MKRLFSVLLICLMTMALITGCGSKPSDTGAGGDFDPESVKTIGDIVEPEDTQFSYDDKTFVFVFTKDGVTYRAVCDMPEDLSKELNSLDAADQDFSEKAVEAAAPLQVTKLENLSEGIPPQEELDELVGKTGQDLIDDGWTVWSWNTDTMEFGMSHDAYNFQVVFDGKIKQSDDLDAEKEIAPLKIKSVTYDGIGDATNIE